MEKLDSMSKKHVVVIGAGPAGISFADRLLELSDEFYITWKMGRNQLAENIPT